MITSAWRKLIIVGLATVISLAVGVPTAAGQPVTEEATPLTVSTVFKGDPIQFKVDDSLSLAREGVRILDNGRLIQTEVELPSHERALKIMAHLTVKPIPKDALSVYDRWDRAGSIRLYPEGQPEIEVIKFVTAYGGRTDWSVDVSHLAPVLRGAATFRAFIDTWVTPAWTVDFELEYFVDSLAPTYHWVQPLFLEDSFDREKYGDSGITIEASIPDLGQQSVKLFYFVSGHCTDGRGADEFVPKDNVLSVDETVVYRYQPWRDDCGDFRAINPYTKRWSDGWWSSDYPRSGWCPGDVVAPLTLDLTDHLAPGDHTLSFRIEDIRPQDENDHKGYWRVSAFLVGVSDPEWQ